MFRKYFYIFISLFVLVSCNITGNKNEPSKKERIEIARYDRLQYEYFATNSLFALQRMNTDFPQATKLLIEDVLSIGKVDDNRINERMMECFRDSTLLSLMNDAEMKYKDISSVEDKINLGFDNLKKELPEIKIPTVYAQLSALNQSIVVGDSILGFSIDKYMGSDYPLYKSCYYDYQRRSMCKDRIASDCFLFYLQSLYPINQSYNFMDIILYKGKINWIVSKILEYESTGKEMGYTRRERKWCNKNEWKILEEIIREANNADNAMPVNKCIKRDTLKSVLGSEVPPAVEIWLGTTLIDRYMKRNRKMTVRKLLEMNDYNKILSTINNK